MWTNEDKKRLEILAGIIVVMLICFWGMFLVP